ncbi:hypothetical protein [Rhizobium rhizogenes]|uniref:hypothetical protein n=1 Tax=Rhizobium rhizogenes TaxID=359 RepID=UPI0012977DC4|nr:hypothetical protein [Rhizobium rhizogenes]MQB34730.1 hypothetical protein [Rhizobium rhizogenes]
MKFSDIPTAEFPMNQDAYSHLRNEVGDIAARFSGLGTPDGAAVAKKMEKIYAALGDAWELIREIERREETP